MPIKKKALEIEEIKKQILNGEYGKPGDRFMSLRSFAKLRNISLVTAQRIMVELRNMNLIILKGKFFYLSYGQYKRGTPLYDSHCNSKLIGLHIPTFDNPYFALLARTVEIVAHKHGYKVITASSGYNPDEEINILQMFEQLGVDGVISCPSRNEETYKTYNMYHLPFVFLSNEIKDVTADRVLIDNYSGGRCVAEHFIQNEFKSFLFIGPKNLGTNSDRLNGFLDAINEHGLSVKKDNIIYVDEQSSIDRNTIAKKISSLPKPLGIFSYHDLISIMVIKICLKYDYKVPTDIGICGYDNLGILKDTFPYLSSVDYRMNEFCENALDLIIRRINGNTKEYEKRLIQPILVVRESSKRINEKFDIS